MIMSDVLSFQEAVYSQLFYIANREITKKTKGETFSLRELLGDTWDLLDENYRRGSFAKQFFFQYAQYDKRIQVLDTSNPCEYEMIFSGSEGMSHLNIEPERSPEQSDL